MITPSYGLTVTERVLPRLALDWTTGLSQTGVDVTRAGVATFVGSNGLIQSATADTQRIDYSTGTAGLLAEESRTNLITYSEDFSTGWQNTRSSVDSNVAIAPDGLQTADKIVEDTSTSSHYQESVFAASAVLPTASIFLKAAERTQAWVRVARDNGAGNASGSLIVDLSNGTIVTGTGFIQPVGSSGWYRVWLTANTTATTNYGVRVGPAVAGGVSYEGDGSSGIYAWGGQLEAAAFPTSYIPTEATAVTRNADVATMTGTNFSDWFNATEGTFAVVSPGGSPNQGTTSRIYAQLAEGSSSDNMISLEYRTATTARFFINSGGANQATISVTKPSTGLTTLCGSYKVDSFTAACNGGAVGSDTSGLVPVDIDTIRFGQRFDGNAVGALNGHVQKIMYWPYQLTAAEVQAFSK